MATEQERAISKKRVKEFIRLTKQSDWPHLLLTVDEQGELKASGIAGRTDLVPQDNSFFLLNVKWQSEETVYYAFWMLVKNRNGYFIEVDE